MGKEIAGMQGSGRAGEEGPDVQYRLLFESNPQPLWVYDSETLAFLAVNDAAVAAYGYSREEFLRMTIADIRPAEDVPLLRAHLAGIRDSYSASGLWRHRKKDSSVIDVEITSHALRFAGRNARLVMATDVTERRRMENAIRAASDEWRSTFDAMNDAVAVLDAQGVIVRCNRAMAEFIGKPFHEVIGLNCRAAIRFAEGEGVRCPFEIMKESGARETQTLHAGEQWYDVTADPLVDRSRALRGAVYVIADVTERKVAEERLLEQKRFSENLVQNSAVAIFVLNGDHRVLIWNRACEELTGASAQEMAGTSEQWRPFYDVQRPVLADLVLSGLADEGRGLYAGISRSVLLPEGLHAEGWFSGLNGRDRYISFDAAPIRDSDGTVIAAIETLQDITERKRAEEQAFRAKQDWDDTFNSITDMVTIHDKNFNIIAANKAAERILGLPLFERTQDRKCFAYYHGADHAPEGCPSCGCIASKVPATFELFEPHLNMMVEIRAIPRFDSAGELIGLIHVVRDITERKKAEDAIARYGRQLTALNTASNRLMTTTKLSGIYQQICDIIYSVFELDMVWLGIVEPDHFLVRPVAHAGREDGYLSSIIITWDDTPSGRGPTGTAIRTGKPVVSSVDDPAFTPWSPEAKKRGYAASMATPLISSNGACIGVLNFYGPAKAFSEDSTRLTQIFANQAAIAIENARLVEGLESKVSERTRALEDANMELQAVNRELELRREEAESASRSKTDFLANMSHELRTPLNAILGFSDIIQMGIAGTVTDKQKEFLKDISTSGQHLLALINDILDLSKIEAGKLELELSEVEVREIVEGSLLLFKEKALKHRMRVVTDIDAGVSSIIADRRKVKQTLINLLSNAFKFTADGGSISVQACKVRGSEIEAFRAEQSFEGGGGNRDEDREFLKISVSDTGIGIAPDGQKKLFQPFEQVDKSLTRTRGGTGLGLSLCRRFVELHGGRIWVRSEAGKGSVFIFAVPIAPAHSRADASKEDRQ